MNTEPGSRWQDRLVFDFDVSETSPVVKGTWVPASRVVDLIADGLTWEEILHTHPELSENDIRCCLAYAVEKDWEPKDWESPASATAPPVSDAVRRSTKVATDPDYRRLFKMWRAERDKARRFAAKIEGQDGVLHGVLDLVERGQELVNHLQAEVKGKTAKIKELEGEVDALRKCPRCGGSGKICYSLIMPAVCPVCCGSGRPS